MNAEGHGPAKDPWLAWLEAAASGGSAAVGSAAGSPAAGAPWPSAPWPGGPWPGAHAAGLDALSAWYGRVSQDLGAVMAARPSDPMFRTGLDEFARAFFAGAVAGMAPFPSAPTLAPGSPLAVLASLGALGSPGAFGFAGTPHASAALGQPASAALGPAREHQQRAAALAAAAAEYAAAQQALAPLLAGAAGAAATAFATRVADGAPRGARASLELWIECAEIAWQDLAHGEAWCVAQARAIDAALAVAACRNDLVEDAARLAGLPSRRELDELHRRLRALERGE